MACSVPAVHPTAAGSLTSRDDESGSWSPRHVGVKVLTSADPIDPLLPDGVVTPLGVSLLGGLGDGVDDVQHGTDPSVTVTVSSSTRVTSDEYVAFTLTVNGAAGGLWVGVFGATPRVTLTATSPLVLLVDTEDTSVWSAVAPVTSGTLADMFADTTPWVLCCTAC